MWNYGLNYILELIKTVPYKSFLFSRMCTEAVNNWKTAIFCSFVFRILWFSWVNAVCLYTGGRCLHYRQFTRSVKSANLTPDYHGRISLLIQSVNHTQTWLHVPCINTYLYSQSYTCSHTVKNTHKMLWFVTYAHIDIMEYLHSITLLCA